VWLIGGPCAIRIPKKSAVSAEMQARWELIRASAPGIVEHFRARLQRPDRQHHGNAGQRVRSIS
jgi:hypothetical protein